MKPGYKQTEVGVIPEDWECVKIGSVAKLESGHTPSKRQPSYWGGTIPWVSLHDTDGLGGREILETEKMITEEGLKNSSARLLPPGTVVFSRTATVGKTTVLGRSMATSQDFANYICGPLLEPFFLMYLFRSMGRTWKTLMAGSIHNTIYMPVFRALRIALPPMSEQHAIVSALSDADALIDSLEQLIAKKRLLKQGAMQDLLTGKKRLPGFEGEWEVKTFNDVLVRVNTKAFQLAKSDYQTSGRFPVVDQGKTKVIGFSDDERLCVSCPVGGVIVFGDHTCITKLIDFDFIVGADGTQILVGRDSQSTRFHAYQLEHCGVPSTGYNRHFKFLKEREFAAPAPAEQTAIASILSDMDAEIAALEAKLAKARQVKQGMMQELLTGKTRLV